MVDIPKNGILTELGFKIADGQRWRYYVSTKCANCNKSVYIKRSDINRAKNGNFCTKRCQSILKHKLVDPIGFNILGKQSTPEFYYLIGLIATDGHINYPPHKDAYYCNIGLIQTDRNLLQQIQSLFGGNLYKSRNQIYWQLNNIGFVEYLKSIGFKHNKTFDLDLADWFLALSEVNKWHFLRGVFDGDGSIGKYYRKRKHGVYWRWLVTLTGAAPKFMSMVHDYLRIGKMYTHYKNQNVYQYQIFHKDLKQFLDNLYQNSSIHLERKYIKYLKFKNE